MAILIVQPGAEAHTLKVVAEAPNRKEATSVLRNLPHGTYDLLTVAETGVVVRDRAAVTATVVERGTPSVTRKRKAAAE